MNLCNVGLVIASDAPSWAESLASHIEATVNEQRLWLKQETGYLFEYRLDVLRSQFDARHWATDGGVYREDDCGNWIETARLTQCAGWVENGVYLPERELNWPLNMTDLSNLSIRDHRRDFVYVGLDVNGYAGGKADLAPDGSSYGECFYGARNYRYLATGVSTDCKGRTFMNLTTTKYAHDHSHERLHHFRVECHVKRAEYSTAKTVRAIAADVGWEPRGVVQVNPDLPLTAGVGLRLPDPADATGRTPGARYITAGGETPAQIMREMRLAGFDGAPFPHWSYLLEVGKPGVEINTEATADVIIPPSTNVWWPGSLWLGEPMQSFQREMFIEANARFIVKAPVVVPIPEPGLPPAPPPVVLTVTPNPVRIGRVFNRTQQLTANKPVSSYASNRRSVATVSASGLVTAVKQGEATVYVKSGTESVQVAVKVNRW